MIAFLSNPLTSAERFVPCSVGACEGNANPYKNGAKGLCPKHYYRLRIHGDPLKTKSTPKGDVQRYYEHVVLSYSGDECLIWPYTGSNGYGQIGRDGRMVVVSRALCEEVNGPPPTPKHHAAHSCGNGHLGCVTKGHLSWKTALENASDRVAHGTHNRGERNPFCRLDEPKVREILSLKGIESQRDIAARFGVHQATVSAIHRGKSWSWLHPNIPFAQEALR